MERDDSPPSAKLLREIAKAEHKLAQIEFHEDLADLYETEPCPRLRRRFAERYRRLIGVEPEQRHTLRHLLQSIGNGGNVPVDDLIEYLRLRHHSNGLSSSST